VRTAPSHATRNGARRPVAVALLVLMAVLSLVLWIGVPYAWMRIASLFTPDSQAFYLLLLVVVPLTMVAVGWVLYRVNRVYVRVSGEAERREHASWLESQAADRMSRQPRRAIDVIMACSVCLALLAFVLWFFFVAGSPLPPG
jgi:hypothetical protein